MGALSYDDDITLIAPSFRSLNEMLKLCDNYATVYNVMFNSKKTVCIKFSNEVIRSEHAFLKISRTKKSTQEKCTCTFLGYILPPILNT